MPPTSVWWIAILAIGVAVAVIVGRRRRAKALMERRRVWGQMRERQRDMWAIGRYYRVVTPEHDTTSAIDDRTWTDLNLDDVFSVIDRTESVFGQQVLYARLRGGAGTNRDAFEALVSRMGDDAPARESAQEALARLSNVAGYDVADLTRPGALETRPWHVLFPVMGLSMLAALLLIPFWPAAVLIVISGSFINLFVRSLVAPSLRLVAGAFRQVGPLLWAVPPIAAIEGPAVAPIFGDLRGDLRKLTRLRRIAGLAGRDSSAALSGDIGALIFEYLNLLLCLDASAFYFGAHELRARAPQLLRVIGVVGDVDAAISIASYRAGTPGWTRPVLRSDRAPFRLVGVRHPLLPDAVPNSLEVSGPRGVIITGSNMSGKSTFLRTIGVTTVMAQTINTCLADTYDAPVFTVRSCIGRADDPASGKSYYLVEVESVVSVVHASRTTVPHLMIFDELFRGTNTVERIAAGEAVLVSLVADGASGAPSPHVVVVATHDLELVDRLRGLYAPYHFADAVSDDGLSFDYRLQHGPATTRNAIALLAQRGAPADLIAYALERAGGAP